MAAPPKINGGEKLLAARLWTTSEDEEQEALLCDASEGQHICESKAFVRVWRTEKSDDALSLCLQHAQRENTIFLVEPVSRQDFHTFEYAALLERSVIARRLPDP